MNATRRKRTGLRTGKDSNLKIMRTLLRKPVAVSAFLPMLVLGLGVGQGARCYAQTQTPTGPHSRKWLGCTNRHPATQVRTANSAAPAAAQPAAKPDPEISLEIAKELAVMKARIEQLEAN